MAIQYRKLGFLVNIYQKKQRKEKQHTFRARADRLLVTLHLKLSWRSRLISGLKFPRWAFIVRSGATFWNRVQVMPLKLLALITCASMAMLWEFCTEKCHSMHIQTNRNKAVIHQPCPWKNSVNRLHQQNQSKTVKHIVEDIYSVVRAASQPQNCDLL